MMATGVRLRTDGLIAATSGAILLATFLPWGTRAGRAVNGWQETRMVLAVGDAVASAWLRGLAMTWYGIPLAAAAIWVVLGTNPEARGVVRALAALVVALAAVSVYVHLSIGGPVRVASAALASFMAGAIVVQARRLRPRRTPAAARRGSR